MKQLKRYAEKISIVLFFLLLPFGRHHVFGGSMFGDFNNLSLYASDFLAISLILAYFSRIFSNLGQLKSTFSTWEALILFFILAGIIFSPRGTNLWYFVLKWLELAILFSYFRNFFQKNRRLILISIICSALLQVLIELGQFINQKSLGLKVLGESLISPTVLGVAKIQTRFGTLIRPYGTFAHPNQLAAFLVVACATSLFLILTSVKTKKITIFLSALIIGTFFTFSRAGILGLTISMGLSLFLIYKAKLQSLPKLKKLWESIIIGFVISIILIVPYATSRLTITDSATSQRLLYDKIGLNIIKNHPFGVGFGGIMPAMAVELHTNVSWQVQPPHNYFILVACETGILGFLIFTAFIIDLLYQQIKKVWVGDDNQKIFNIYCLVLLVNIIFLMQWDHYFYTLQQTQLLLWVVLGIISGNVSKARAYS